MSFLMFVPLMPLQFPLLVLSSIIHYPSTLGGSYFSPVPHTHDKFWGTEAGAVGGIKVALYTFPFSIFHLGEVP